MGNLKLQALPKLMKRHNKRHNGDAFIVNHCRRNRFIMDAKLVESHMATYGLKRLVFTSLFGLKRTWKECPYHALYSAVFIVPLKRAWMYNLHKHVEELKLSILCQSNLFTSTTELLEFAALLQWKDSQGLVFWALDHDADPAPSKDGPCEATVHPFWTYVSSKMSKLYNPVTGQKYKPLDLDLCRLKTGRCMSQDAVSSVESELCNLNLHFDAMAHILSCTDADSVCAIKSYVVERHPGAVDPKLSDLFDEMSDLEDGDDWWISADYDPEDLDEPTDDDEAGKSDA